MSQKKLREMLCREYSVQIDNIAAEDGDGYMAFMPEFGPDICSGVGDTQSEAAESLQSAREAVFEYLVTKDDFDFPEPFAPTYRQTAAKKVLLRLPPGLHRQIVEAAKRAGSSANAYMVRLLEGAVRGERTLEHMTQIIKESLSPINDTLRRSLAAQEMLCATMRIQSTSDTLLPVAFSRDMSRWGNIESASPEAHIYKDWRPSNELC